MLLAFAALVVAGHVARGQDVDGLPDCVFPCARLLGDPSLTECAGDDQDPLKIIKCGCADPAMPEKVMNCVAPLCNEDELKVAASQIANICNDLGTPLTSAVTVTADASTFAISPADFLTTDMATAQEAAAATGSDVASRLRSSAPVGTQMDAPSDEDSDSAADSSVVRPAIVASALVGAAVYAGVYMLAV